MRFWRLQPVKSPVSSTAYSRQTKRARGGERKRRLSPTFALLEDRCLLSTPTVTTLGISASSLTYGQSELFSATVTTNPPSGTTPTGGTVTFMDGPTTLATKALSAGSATFSTTSLGAGLHVVTAIYSGDAQFGGSHSGISSGSIITTEAGGGMGDGGPATQAPTNVPFGVAIAPNGDLFIAENSSNAIRKVSGATGTITTVAGNGVSGYSGDGGAATSAEMSAPAGVAVDSTEQHLFIADAGNHVIREVNLVTGVITTVAGNGTKGYSGDGGPATAAMLFDPSGVALDSAGDLFIADTGNNAVREVSVATGKIATVAGNGTIGATGDGGPATAATLHFPMGLVLDSLGNIFIADSFNNKVREVKAATGVITTVAGTGVAGDTGNGGQAISATLNEPLALAVNSSGELLIADLQNNVVRKVILGTGNITQVAGTGTAGYTGDGGAATSAKLNKPAGVALDATTGNFFIADSSNNVVREVVASTGNINPFSGNGSAGFYGDGGSATLATLHSASGVAVDSNGDVFIADTANNRIREVNATTGVITTVAGTGIAGYSGDGGAATSATLNQPTGVALDSSGNILIADFGNSVIRKVNVATGVITTVAGNGTTGYSGDGGPATSAELANPRSVVLDSFGNIIIADSANSVVREVSASTGKITTIAGDGNTGDSGDGGPATAAELNLPEGIAVDSFGNIFIADLGNNKIRKVTAAGTISTVAGNGTTGSSGDGGPATSAELNAPINIAVDSAGNLFIADSNNNKIREVSAATGNITTVVGNGVGNYRGDGGAPLSAELNQPDAVAVGITGTLYIADQRNNVIREVSTTYVGQNVTVAKAALSITAVSETMAAGQAVPALTASYNGFVNGDSVASLTTPPVLSTTATSASPPGVYSITASGATSPNYTITFVPGSLTVTPSSPPSPPPVAPTIVGESVVINQKFNKKHKPIGKATLSGYTITFSTAMDQTALANHANYQVALKVIKKVKVGKKKVPKTLLQAIGFSVSQVTSNSVTLKLAGNQKFPKGGQITVIATPPGGVDNTSDVFLAHNGVLAISPAGKRITLMS
jgi:trimeric autotransporter adhesin